MSHALAEDSLQPPSLALAERALFLHSNSVQALESYLDEQTKQALFETCRAAWRAKMEQNHSFEWHPRRVLSLLEHDPIAKHAQSHKGTGIKARSLASYALPRSLTDVANLRRDPSQVLKP